MFNPKAFIAGMVVTAASVVSSWGFPWNIPLILIAGIAVGAQCARWANAR